MAAVLGVDHRNLQLRERLTQMLALSLVKSIKIIAANLPFNAMICMLSDKLEPAVLSRVQKSPEAEDHTLYASHTVWEDRAVFEAWTKSEAFRAAHSRAGDNKPLYLDHPQFEGFEVRQTVGRGRAA